MYDSATEMIEALRATPDVLGALLRGVTPQRARSARGGDENWSVVEVVCHLRDAEERALERMRAMRDEENPSIHGYDQEAWARERNYAADNLGNALSAFLRLRAQHTAELAELRPEQWERRGRHDEAGAISISGHTLHMVWHDAIHSAQIARQLAG